MLTLCKVDVQKAFENFYMIEWGEQIKSDDDAKRFLRALYSRMCIPIIDIDNFLDSLLGEGVMLYEETVMIKINLGRI